MGRTQRRSPRTGRSTVGRLLVAFACGVALPVASADDTPAEVTRPKCKATFDKGWPQATLLPEKTDWSVKAEGAYRIDAGYRFEQLQVHVSYRDTKTGKVRNGPTYTVPNEDVIVKGRWSVAFRLAAPTADEVLRMRVALRVKGETGGGADEFARWSDAIKSPTERK